MHRNFLFSAGITYQGELFLEHRDKAISNASMYVPQSFLSSRSCLLNFHHFSGIESRLSNLEY